MTILAFDEHDTHDYLEGISIRPASRRTYRRLVCNPHSGVVYPVLHRIGWDGWKMLFWASLAGTVLGLALVGYAVSQPSHAGRHARPLTCWDAAGRVVTRPDAQFTECARSTPAWVLEIHSRSHVL